MAENSDPTENEINIVSSLRIFFGHQSVGFNIIDGITDITSSFNIVESESIPENGPVFLHSEVGSNINPASKIREFSDIINRIGGNCDVAFLKLCYIDFSANTDVQSIFNYYRNTISDLKNRYPDITFVHFTAPLTTVQSGPKALAKKMLGKPLQGEAENIQRQKYNELIRNEYGGREPILDIAEIESTKPAGSRVENKTDGYVYYSLFEEYTNDGGHLNNTGRKIVAGKLIKLLSKLN